MACMVMAYVYALCKVRPSKLLGCSVYVVMAHVSYGLSSHAFMAHIVMAYVVMAHIVMASSGPQGHVSVCPLESPSAEAEPARRGTRRPRPAHKQPSAMPMLSRSGA